MSTAVILGLIWVLVAAAIATLPRRFHPWGAIPLLIAAVPLIWAIFGQSGALAGVVALGVLVSVLRYPLMYLGRRLWRRIAGRSTG